ncbi:MAG: 4Fe-4S dicluster domain-containing protein [Bacteroidales bacterium]|jgi:Fe-S-cluster-containing hydrogenase component 2|nr:4Fe-4S dicluster domain-containing protein [Bacteroidales bacterium]
MSDRNKRYTRRHFLQDVVFGGSGLIVLGTLGFRIINDKEHKLIKAISVDFDKCAGCRTCETACSAFNHKALIGGEEVHGLGNPYYSNIKVYHFNPDVDIPVTCAICPDAPCIDACPVAPDLITGRKALYRDPETMTIKNDIERCVGCMQCAKTCDNLRGGVIHPNPSTHKPERMCTLCHGDPQCVKHCPFDALAYIEMPVDRDLDNLSPETIAQRLIQKYYEIKV